jgi:hypothetical protein
MHVCGREDKYLGDGDRVEPSLDPAPDRREKEGRADDEDTYTFGQNSSPRLSCGISSSTHDRESPDSAM